MDIKQIQIGMTVRVSERQRTGYFKAPANVRQYARPEFEEAIVLPAITGIVDNILHDADDEMVVVRVGTPDGEGYYECTPSEIEPV